MKHRNDRLSALLEERRMTFEDLAARVGVDAKTVQRWVYTGRAPHRRHQQEVCALLKTDRSYLFPGPKERAAAAVFSKTEVVDVHPSRMSIDGQFMADRIDSAQDAIDILVYGGSFLHDSVPNAVQRLVDRASSGVAVRLLLGDPDSDAVKLRGTEEGIGSYMEGRCRHTWRMFSPLIGAPGITAAKHGETLYNSMFRFDDLLFVNAHIYGSPAGDNPILELRRRERGRLFDRYLGSFQRTWDAAKPVYAEDIPSLVAG